MLPGGGSVRDAWRRLETVEEDVDLVDNELGSGSDYTVFLNYLGIPVIDMTYGPYGVYHFALRAPVHLRRHVASRGARGGG